MSVPEAAVEAAARALDEHNRPGMWEHESERYKDAFRREARIQLEAAAPHLLAEAFEQGQTSGMRYASRVIAANKIGRPELPGPISPNPYRSQA